MKAGVKNGEYLRVWRRVASKNAACLTRLSLYASETKQPYLRALDSLKDIGMSEEYEKTKRAAGALLRNHRLDADSLIG